MTNRDHMLDPLVYISADITSLGTSKHCTVADAVDATIFANEMKVGQVTLVRDSPDDDYDVWGTPEEWADDDIIDCLDDEGEAQRRIVVAVSQAVQREARRSKATTVEQAYRDGESGLTCPRGASPEVRAAWARGVDDTIKVMKTAHTIGW